MGHSHMGDRIANVVGVIVLIIALVSTYNYFEAGWEAERILNERYPEDTVSLERVFLIDLDPKSPQLCGRFSMESKTKGTKSSYFFNVYFAHRRSVELQEEAARMCVLSGEKLNTRVISRVELGGIITKGKLEKFSSK